MQRIRNSILLLCLWFSCATSYSQGITNSGTSIFINPGTTITVTGDVSNTDGQFNLTGNSSVTLTGNLINNAPVNIINESISDGTIRFSGVAPIISGTSSLFTLANAEVNGPLQLQHTIDIKDNLNLNSTLDIGNFNIRLKQGTAGIVNETAANRIFTNGSGTVEYTLAASPLLSDQLGGIGLRLEGPVFAGAKIIRGHTPQANSGNGSISRYFDVQPNTGDVIQQVRFYYFNNEVPGSISEADLVLYASYDGAVNWQKIGGVINTTLKYVEISGLSITNNVRLTLASKDCTSYPVVNLGLPTQNLCNTTTKILDAGNTGSYYEWSTTANTQTISVTTAGAYSVIVRNAKGCEGTGSVTLVARPQPVPAFTNGVACPGKTENFSNTSSIASGTMTYLWDFGDPLSTTDNSTATNTAYTYTTAADYSVVLTATSDYNCVATLTKTVTVHPLPQTDFTFSNACIGRQTVLTNTSTIANGGMTYEWDFDDGTTSTIASPGHSFPAINNYNVSLKATSNAGCQVTASKPVGIHPTPVAVFNASDVCEGINSVITNTSSIASGTISYTWNFGDATTSSAAVPVKSYVNSGSYIITLDVTSDFNCVTQATKSIEIHDNPIAAFSVPDNCQNVAFNFTNSSTSSQGTLSYGWDFDDATTSSMSDPEKLFSAAGTYDVALTATTSLGCKANAVKQITVFPMPQTDFTFINGCQDVAFLLTNTSSITSGTMAYAWDFGDATSSTLISPSKQYDLDGTYQVKLNALSDKGCSVEKVKSLEVYPMPVLDFGSSISTCGTSYTLDALNPGSSYLWSTGSTDKTYTATQNGNYSVQVTTIHSCRITTPISITLKGEVLPNLGGDQTVCGHLTLNAGYPGSSYLWSDGSASGTLDVQSTGNYSVRITDQNGCIGEDHAFITVNPIPVVQLGNDIIVCANQQVVLDAQNSGDQFLWSDNSTNRTLIPLISGSYSVAVTNNFNCTGNDQVEVTINPMPVNTLPASLIVCDQVTLNAGNAGSTYLWNGNQIMQALPVTTSGIYSVSVTTEANCTSEFYSNITVNYSPPVQLGADVFLCYGQTVLLDAGTTGDSYLWSDNSKEKSLTASKSGLYKVTVARLNGCSTKDSVQVTIYPEIVNTLKKQYEICFNEARLIDAISAQGINYQWFSSAGLLSNSSAITVSKPDRFQVITKDNIGCSRTDSVNVITDPDPITARYLVVSFADVGDSVRFVQLSYPDPVSFDWSFADGTTSKVSDPVHQYLRPGDFNSSLYIRDPNECHDTKEKTITIRLLRDETEQEVTLPFLEWSKYEIYPNPAVEFLNIQLSLNQQSDVQVMVCAIDGKVVKSKTYRTKDEVMEMDLRGLPSGVFIVKVMINREIRSSRFIKI